MEDVANWVCVDGAVGLAYNGTITVMKNYDCLT